MLLVVAGPDEEHCYLGLIHESSPDSRRKRYDKITERLVLKEGCLEGSILNLEAIPSDGIGLKRTPTTLMVFSFEKPKPDSSQILPSHHPITFPVEALSDDDSNKLLYPFKAYLSWFSSDDPEQENLAFVTKETSTAVN